MSMLEMGLFLLAIVGAIALFVSVGLHKYAWWKYSKGTIKHDPIYSFTAAYRFFKDPGFFIKPDGLKYEYWSQMIMYIYVPVFLICTFVIELLRQYDHFPELNSMKCRTSVSNSMVRFISSHEMFGKLMFITAVFVSILILLFLALDVLHSLITQNRWVMAAPAGTTHRRKRQAYFISSIFGIGIPVLLLVYFDSLGWYRVLAVSLFLLLVRVLARKWVDMSEKD